MDSFPFQFFISGFVCRMFLIWCRNKQHLDECVCMLFLKMSVIKIKCSNSSLYIYIVRELFFFRSFNLISFKYLFKNEMWFFVGKFI